MVKSDFTPDFLLELSESNEKSLQFVADLKWANGFTCTKCGNTNFCNGKTHASRRCTRCKKEESATVNTIFHNCKFPINKALYIIYTTCFMGAKTSVNELGNQLEVNPMTCWKFRKRIYDCVEKHKDIPKEKLNISTLILQK